MARKGGNIVNSVTKIAEPIAKELGLSLWDIVYEKEGSLWYLRVYIEKPDSDLSIDDCVNMTRPLDKALDELDPTGDSYVLEVSSPGLERRLTKDSHLERYIGQPVKLRFVRDKGGVREVSGRLEAFTKEAVRVEADGNTTDYRRSELAFIKADDLIINDMD
ncbi:MAG: ribosome maturation factor RimP [Ruminococcus sp.]|jgi:ribosome maturation factor RimP|nr:ribosome maturation factor RimP [Ruminococcus sp.]